jgi:ribonuclease E
VEQHHNAPVASEGHSHAAKAPEPAAPAQAAAKADEPIILGVGVPASEL